MSKTTTNADRTEQVAFNLIEKAIAIYADWMTPRQSRQLNSLLKRLDKLGYERADVLDILAECSE